MLIQQKKTVYSVSCLIYHILQVPLNLSTEKAVRHVIPVPVSEEGSHVSYIYTHVNLIPVIKGCIVD